MKKILIAFVALAISALTALAAVDNVWASASVVTTAAFTNSYVVRGEVYGVVVTIPATKTGAVSIVTASGLTLFNASGITSATDGYFPIRFPMYSPAGTLLADSASTNVYGTVAIAESVTFTVTPQAGTSGTNTFTAELIIEK